MGRNCSICAHPKVKEINKALVAPDPNFSAIARIYRVDRDSVRRHLEKGHVSEKIAKAAAAQEAIDADDLLNEIKAIQGHQVTIFNEARNRKKKVENEEGDIEEIKIPDNKLALEALRDQSKIIELKGKILGSFKADKPREMVASTLSDEEVERRAREILAKRKR